MCVASLFTECGFLITLFLAKFVAGDPAVFTENPKNMSVEVGSNIVINWKYNTTDRSNFELSSPLWKYYDENNTEHQLASEDKTGLVWKWEITNLSCPPRFWIPIQRLHKYKPEEEGSASLNITNVSLADSGKYECQLKILFQPTVKSSMYLTVVKKALPVMTAAPTKPASTSATPSTTFVPSIIPTTGPTKSRTFLVTIKFNMTFSHNYTIKTSKEYKNVENTLCEQLMKDKNLKDVLKCSVTEIRNGSLVVDIKLTFSEMKDALEVEKSIKRALDGGTKLAEGFFVLSIKVTTIPEDEKTYPKKGLSDGEIAGIVIGVLVVMAIIVVVVFCVVKKKKDGRGKFQGIQMG